MASFPNFHDPRNGGGYGQSDMYFASSQPGFGPSIGVMTGGNGPSVPTHGSGRRGNSKAGNGALGNSFLAVCGIQMLLCLVLHSFLAAMPGEHIRHTLFNGILIAVSAIGLVAAIQRTRPLLNMHFMVAMLGMSIGLNMVTSFAKDINLGCNIILIDMNLHVAEESVLKMGNQAMMDSVSSRLIEMDHRMHELEESSHAHDEARKADKNLMHDDYHILHSKIDSLKRHAETVQEQVMHMTAMLRQKAESERTKEQAKAEAAKKHEKKVQKAADKGKPEPEMPDLDEHAEQVVKEEREEILEKGKVHNPHQFVDDFLAGKVELSPAMQNHLAKLRDLFNKADKALEAARHPVMGNTPDGDVHTEMHISARDYKVILADLTAAAHEIVAMEHDLGKELGGTKVHEIGKQAAQEMFQNADADDDDYLEFEDYDDYGDHDYRMRNQRPQAIKEGPATHDLLKDLHHESDEIAARIHRYGNKHYNGSNRHQAQVQERRQIRHQRRLQSNQILTQIYQKTLNDHDQLMQMWDRGEPTCQNASGESSRLGSVCMFILLAQFAAAYFSLSLIFHLPLSK